MDAEIPKVFPDLGLPQVVPVFQDMIEEYTTKPENLPVHSLIKNLQHIEPSRNLDPLFRFHSTQIPLVQQVKRDPKTGKLLGHEEVEIGAKGQTAKNSFDLTRAPGREEGLTGSSANYPFWPGGFDEEKELLQTACKASLLKIQSDSDESELFKRLFDSEFRQIPPGFDTGLDLTATASLKSTDVEPKLGDVTLNLNFWQGTEKNADVTNKLSKGETKAEKVLQEIPDEMFQVEELENKPTAKPPLTISKTSTSSQHIVLPWAELLDVTKPMTDFHEKVPNMAYIYSFELDTFQKQALAKLEEHENVFVAAHTSAGKTVVAEYAIALSVQHMTRTIYTSPIKALSNQKFREFKKGFDSVGLVTGDVQINPGASVLIMTTEILRSMLYNGSDVIRDLEWVVFDEIHYLNNEERGHVWEEVLIMLPPHVSIIMLSATVPNAMQFANWVGEIKRKKIYVITTLKRPVPLEHHLYTGSGGKTRDEVFLILGSDGKFSKKGYDNAKAAKLQRMSKHQQSFGPKGGRGVFNENQEKTTYIGLINHLKENDKLPVVIFTFSRNRCDQYAQLLSNVDLCTGAQKAEIHGFFMTSISKLKGSDRELPQVVAVRELLKNGIGVHHSGILPILKEVVEMLFSIGLVKLLFATETFAMGVNMPARTVVFDSIRKHDGTNFRTLNPAEYIQMAGRAGRRGLDTTGTVILMCKQAVPPSTELQNMILGKAAKLESQFRLTYSMILNLLRVESLTVEDVMKRSFLEASSRLKVDYLKDKIQKIRTKLDDLEWNNSDFDTTLINFYKEVKECISQREYLAKFKIAHTKKSVFCPGRFIIVESLSNHCSARYGVILENNSTKSGQNRFNVLILKSDKDSKSLSERGFEISTLIDEKLYNLNEVKDKEAYKFEQFLYYASSKPTCFEPAINEHHIHPHCFIQVDYLEIYDVLDKVIRIDPDSILGDIRRRSTPRFASEAPIPQLKKLVDELCKLHQNPESIPFITPSQFLATTDVKVTTDVNEIEQLRAELKRKALDQYSLFKSKFHEVYGYMRLKDTLSTLEYLLSPRSLQLHEEYQSRINVLRSIKYIDKDNLVQLKGRVACEVGNQNELLVTEMVLHNMFATAPPAEVAAILSCLVFEAKKVEEPKLDGAPELKKRIEEVKKLARKIGETQRENGLKEPVQQYVEQFRFGLAEVVYEWAKGKSFYEIMKLTDVQEGLIVRTIQRLDEMIRDVKDAARIIGDPSLKKKMEESSECIKRDIVFAASLYTQ